MRTAVLGPDLGDAVDAGFELGLGLPELREGRGEMGEFLGGWVMGENPTTTATCSRRPTAS